MNPLRHQSYKNEKTETKKPWQGWLTGNIYELIKNDGWY